MDILHQKNHNIDIVRHYSLTKVNINWYSISNLVKKLHTVSQKGQKVNIKNEFGLKIKRMRKYKKLTQEQLAELIDISPRNLSAIEVGSSFPKAETLEKILIALNISLDDLFEANFFQNNELLYENIINNIKYLKNDYKKLEAINNIVNLLINQDVYK